MDSPCKDCTRRKVGCHNVKTCPDWKVYVTKREREKERRTEVSVANKDRINHVVRITKRKPRQS